MATVQKTIPWSFLTHGTNVATDTTFGATTTHTFGPIDVEIETSRDIKAAWLEMTFQTQNTSALDLDGWEAGIDVNGGGVTSQQYTSALVDTGENECRVLIHDVTAELIADLDAGQTQSIEATIAAISESASNINCLTCTLHITYDCDNDDTVYFTYVDIPIHSHQTVITNSFSEFGTTTGVINAPPNQIPQLTGAGGWLSDSGIGFTAIHQAKLHLFARQGDNTANDQTLLVSLDGGSTSNARPTIEQALAFRLEYWDIVDLTGDDSNMTLTTTAAAALTAANSTATNGYSHLGGFVRVVFEIDPTSATRELHCLRPAMNIDEGNKSQPGNEIVDGCAAICTIDIQEPGPITMWQSAFVIVPHSATNQNGTNQFHARGQQIETTQGQTGRIWGNSNVASAGQMYWYHRADIQRSTWSLGVGKNTLVAEFSQQTLQVAPTMFAIVNYFSDIPAAGVGVGNRTVGWPIAEYSEGISGAPLIYSNLTAVPSITDSESNGGNEWVASSFMLEHYSRAAHNGNLIGLGFERNSGEDTGRGFVGFGNDGQSLVVNENQHLDFRSELLSAFKSRGLDYSITPTKKMDPFQDRRLHSSSALSRGSEAVVWMTYHCVRSSIDIEYTIDGSPVTGASKVRVLAQSPDTPNDWEPVVLPADVTLDGSGQATLNVLDRTVGYQALGLDTTRGLSDVVFPSALGRTPRIVERTINFTAASGVPSVPSPVALLPYDIVVVQITMGGGITTSLDTANGFALLDNQDSTDCAQYLYWKRVAEDELSPLSMPVFSSFAGYFAGYSYVIRGCKRTGNPFNVVAKDNAASGTAVALPTVTTTVDDCLIAGHLSNGTDTNTPQTTAHAWTCAALVGGVREYGTVQTTNGGGGGCCVVAGIMPGQGATGTIDGTLAGASTQSRITVAFEPEALTTGTLTIDPETGGAGGGSFGPHFATPGVMRRLVSEGPG